MQIEPTNKTDTVCKDMIGEAYPGSAGFSGPGDLWDNVQMALAPKGALDLCTTRAEDNKAMDILEEVFEKAEWATQEDGRIAFASTYVDYKRLWERICAVIGVTV